MQFLKAWWLFAGLFIVFGLNAQVVHPNAHAHNDYEHERPLFDALANGFTSFEADIHLIDDQLYVVHDSPKEVIGLPTLKDLYLDPLKLLVEKNNGWVHKSYKNPVYLMIDIKTEAQSTYLKLKEVLEPYRKFLTTKEKKGAITIFISGNRPKKMVANDSDRLVGLDGRPDDLKQGWDSNLMPVISDHYNNHFQWDGIGQMPSKEWKKLKRFVKKTHQEKKKVRLWASPEKETVWAVLLRAKVDFINTDQLAELNEFLKSQK